MGRPSKLTPQDEAEIKTRLLNGEKPIDLAKEFKISRSTFSERFSETVRNLKSVINQVVATQDVFSALPLSEQLTVISFTDRLRNISNNLAGAAEHGSLTSYILSGVASRQAAKVNQDEPMESQEILQAISALTKISNEAAVIGTNLINANKDKVAEPVKTTRKTINFTRAVASGN